MEIDNKKIDELYSVRSRIRSIYLNNDVSECENEIRNNIFGYINIDIDIKSFTINIEYQDKASIKLCETLNIIRNILEKFIKSKSNDYEIINYLVKGNAIFDFFIVGNCVKFIL